VEAEMLPAGLLSQRPETNSNQAPFVRATALRRGRWRSCVLEAHSAANGRSQPIPAQRQWRMVRFGAITRLSRGKTMDPRVCEVMQMLHKQALTPGNSNAAIGESENKEEQKMSFEKMALKFDLSESRMRALFKSQVGLSPTQYVKKLKMDEAAIMLKDSNKRVNEIGAKLRINDFSHFVRDFKKAHGMTPTQYRKFHQRQSEG
jgi:AraC-like DNA-binding protein